MALVSVGVLVCVANGYGWCIEMWNWDGKRVANDGKRWPSGDGVVITYVNGIFHTKIEWEVITGKLQEMFCHEVRPQPSQAKTSHPIPHPSMNSLEVPSNGFDPGYISWQRNPSLG